MEPFYTVHTAKPNILHWHRLVVPPDPNTALNIATIVEWGKAWRGIP